MARGTRLGLLAIVLAGMPCGASADSFCGPGKHLGSYNFDGPSKDWRCVPDGAGVRSGGAGSIDYGSAAGAAVGILGLIQDLWTQIKPTDAAGPVAAPNNSEPSEVVMDRGRTAIQSREDNRKGIAEMEARHFLRAAIYFSSAAEEALAGGNASEARLNEKNAAIAKAEDYLVHGYELEKAGKLDDAAAMYQRGRDVISGFDPDLAAKLDAGTKRTPSTQCKNVNGKILCN